MCGGASGCLSLAARSRQSDCHRTAASRQPQYIAPTSQATSSPARRSKRAPSLARPPVFIPTGGVKSIDRNEIPRPAPPGELLLIETHVDYADAGSQVLWEDGERVFRRGWRLDNDGERRAVLIVLPAADHPSRSSLDHLTHEYEFKDELDEARAVLPLDLVREDGRTMLVLEDAGGERLERLLGAPMEVERFLRLAIGVAVALGKLHQRGLVHKDVKPANILINRETGAVRLTGFGIASRLA